MSNMNKMTLGDEVCNDFTFTLQGKMNLDELKEIGINITMFDGYGVAYDYTLRDTLGVEDMQLTCFGFD